MMQQQTTIKLKVTDINEHLLCLLCGGYLVDATTIIECLHSFCRSCIVKHLEANRTCPHCDVVIHKTKPLLNLRSDRTLQTLVYKLVPGVFQSEKQKRRQFYASRPEAVPTSGADAGDIEESHLMYTEDEKISLCLQHCDRIPWQKYGSGQRRSSLKIEKQKEKDKRFLLCPALVTIGCLKKFVQHKFDLPSHLQVEIFHSDESLKCACTLMDVANIYSWKRTKPLTLYYIVFDKTQLSLELPDPLEVPIVTTNKTANKRPRKRNPSSKSPNGLVKSRSFKPPKSRVAKISKKKTVSMAGGRRARDNAGDILVAVKDKQGNGEISVSKRNSDVDSVKESNNVKDKQTDSLIDLSTGHELVPASDTNKSATGAKDQGNNGACYNGDKNHEEMDTTETNKTENNVTDSGGENGQYDIVMDTVDDEHVVSDQSGRYSEEDPAVVKRDSIKSVSEDEQPLSVVKIKLKSPPRDWAADADVTVKNKGKRSSKADKSRLSTKKSKSPKHRRKSDKTVKEYEIVICMDTSSEERALEASSRGANDVMSPPAVKQDLVDLTEGDDSGQLDDSKCGVEGASKVDIVKLSNSNDLKCSVDKDKLGITLPEMDTERQKQDCRVKDNNSDKTVSGAENTRQSPEHDPTSPSTGEKVIRVSTLPCPHGDTEIPSESDTVTRITEISEKSEISSVNDRPNPLKENHVLGTNDKDTDIANDQRSKVVDNCEREKTNSLVNQPDLVRSAVPLVECKCGKSIESSRSPSWIDKNENDGNNCSRHSEDSVGDNGNSAAIEHVTCDPTSPPVTRTEWSREPLSPAMNHRETVNQRESPASSICSISSSVAGQYEMTMDDSLSSPGSQTSNIERDYTPGANTTPVGPRHRKISANRDKAKSINSIIKQIEERKSKKGEVNAKVTLSCRTAPESVSSPALSPSTAVVRTLGSLSACDRNPSQSVGYSSSPSTAPGLTQAIKPPKPQSKRRNLAATQSSPDGTPMKRLKQLCSDFGDDSVTETPTSCRNRPASTPATAPSVGNNNISSQMYYPQYSRGRNTAMDPRAMMQAVQLEQLHQLQQQAAQQQAVQQQAVQQQAVQQQAVQQQAVQQKRQLQKQQQRSHQQNTQKRFAARNHCPSGMTRSPISPHSHEIRPLMPPYSTKIPELSAPRHGNVRPQIRPTETLNSPPLNSNKTVRPSTPLRPAHTGPNPYLIDYSASNPLANGYDEPLELTTKKSRDRKVADEQPHHRASGTFLKIPTLMKP